jgi:hypothetical protein
MSKTKIIGKNVTKQQLKELMELAAEAGCHPDDLEVVESVGEPDPEAEDEVFLVLATPATCADPDLEQEFAKAQNGGRRVVCVWPKSAGGAQPAGAASKPAQLPDAASKYAYSVLPWHPKKLSGVLADDDVTCFENDAGVPLPRCRWTAINAWMSRSSRRTRTHDRLHLHHRTRPGVRAEPVSRRVHLGLLQAENPQARGAWRLRSWDGGNESETSRAFVVLDARR